MQRRLPVRCALLVAAALATGPAWAGDLEDPHFGEALYYAHQGDWFGALERLDTEVGQHVAVDEPNLDSLYAHFSQAEFSLGDFELRYRMHHRAGRAIKAVLEGTVDDDIRNDAAYRLARIHFQKGQMEDAARALNRIEGDVPKIIRDDIEFLRANIYLAQERSEESLEVLEELQDSKSYGGFASYNLGIAYLQGGRRSEALEQLEKAGLNETADPGELAIRDKANLVLGTIFLEEGQYERALPFLNRVRLDGPFSNQALLSAGWASLSSENYERAIVPWSILARREVTDSATQEALLALPYAYGQLEIHGRAAIYYGQALDAFLAEIEKLSASIESIRDGKFLEALIREEIRQDEDWVIRLRSLPETPETYYLMELMASHDFQTGLRNYLDLADLKRKLLSWEGGFDAYDDMVGIRREHYAPLLPEIDDQFRKLDSRMRLRIEQHKMLVERRDDLLTMPRPEFLATPEEKTLLERIEHIAASLVNSERGDREALEARLQRLKGLVVWEIETRYHERFTEFDRNLRSLDDAMAVAQAEYDEYVRNRQAASHSYEGYDKPITRLRADVSQAVQRIDRLMARQGYLLEVAAIDELMARRDHLENYGDKARFALADSYDRATQAQARAETNE
ncbi:MAG TPA: tetratricopeptide repeat protein [Woeseiaceae bacterium]|nr:tetratricopeptide repeat protein [Woeseiaceae bacterium]